MVFTPSVTKMTSSALSLKLILLNRVPPSYTKLFIVFFSWSQSAVLYLKASSAQKIIINWIQADIYISQIGKIFSQQCELFFGISFFTWIWSIPDKHNIFRLWFFCIIIILGQLSCKINSVISFLSINLILLSKRQTDPYIFIRRVVFQWSFRIITAFHFINSSLSTFFYPVWSAFLLKHFYLKRKIIYFLTVI